MTLRSSRRLNCCPRRARSPITQKRSSRSTTTRARLLNNSRQVGFLNRARTSSGPFLFPCFQVALFFSILSFRGALATKNLALQTSLPHLVIPRSASDEESALADTEAGPLLPPLVIPKPNAAEESLSPP